MTVVLAICVAVVFTVSTFMILGQELKGVAIGVFLLGHAANLSIIAMSGSPIEGTGPATHPKNPPLVEKSHHAQADDAADNAPNDAPDAASPRLAQRTYAVNVAPHGAAQQAVGAAAHGATPAHDQPTAQQAERQVQSAAPLNDVVDPLPQALILTAIVIGFGVMGFLLSLIVVTARTTRTLNLNDLAKEQLPTPSEHH